MDKMFGMEYLRRASLVVIGFMLIACGFIILPGEVSAQTPIESVAALDGYIERSDPSYPPPGPGTVDTTDDNLFVGQYRGSTNKDCWRSYLSFNTSYIPDNAVISSVIFKIRLDSDLSTTDFSVQLYRSDYTTLDTGDWDAYSNIQGVLLNSASAVEGNWYSIYVSGTSVNKSGMSQYMLKSSNDNTTAPINSEFLLFYSGDSSYAPTLTVAYTEMGTTISILTTTGFYWNSTMYADIQAWNLTYELWCFEFDTFPYADNASIAKGNSSWVFEGITPLANYTVLTDSIELTDLFDSISYRLWFTVPKSNPFSTVHISLYNAFTGEGFFWEQMKVQMCIGSTWDNSTAETVYRPDFDVESEWNYTIRVLDYFNNPLVDYQFTANSEHVFVSIPVPVYSWQVFNMNEQPVLLKIFWNNTGSPWEFFVGPQWIVERFLKGGNYTFMVTFYEPDGSAGITVSYERTVPNVGLNASFIYVSGTNLSEIISDIEGVMATQAIITSLISPSVVLVYENLPMAPVKVRSLALEDSIVIDPYEILEATTYQNATGTSGVDTTLEQAHPDVVGATYYVLSDVLSFSGTYASEIYINDSLGANLYHNTVLPATVNLEGQEVTIWVDADYSVSRASTFREITEFAINYYPTQHKWETNMVLNNSHTLDYYTPYWYIAFPENATICQETVTLYDLDNGVYLSQRTNFDVTAGGVHVTLTQLNASLERNFRLTYWDFNSSSGIGAPNLVAEAYTQSTLNGVPMKYTAVQWFNTYSVEYRGEVYITLNFTYGDYLLRSSIVIIDETTGAVIPNSQYIYTERTIILLTDGVGTVPVGGARNYGIYFTLDYAGAADDQPDFFFGPIVVGGKQAYIGGYAVSYFIVLVLAVWVIAIWAFLEKKRGWDTLVLVAFAGTIVGAYLGGFM